MPQKTIYLDYQATTPTHPFVVECMSKFWSEDFGNPHSSEHVFGWNANKSIEEAREKIARLVGAFAQDVIFTSGATEANNLAILGHLKSIQSSQRIEVLVGSTEHKCVSEANKSLSHFSATTLRSLPVNAKGICDLNFVEEQISDKTYLVSLMLVNNEIGAINDIKSVYGICQKYGVFLHCDASQATTTMDVSWLADYADSISLSGHKMYAPMGIGALIISPSLHSVLSPVIFGGGQERGFRSGTLPVPLCVGLGAASDFVQTEEFHSNIQKVSELRDEFFILLQNLHCKVSLNGPDFCCRHKTNLNVTFDKIPANDLLGLLQPDVCASSGAACSSGVEGPSETLLAIGLGQAEANSSIRFSFGLNNNSNDLNDAFAAIKLAIGKLS